MGDRWAVGALAALAPVSLLAVDPAGWFPFGPAKWLAVSTLLPVGAAGVMRTRGVRVPGPVLLAVAGWLGCVVVAAAVGLDPIYAWTGTPERHLGVLTWALAALALAAGASLDPRRDGPLLGAGVAAAGLGVGGVASVEALGWEPAVLDVGSRLTGPLGSSAYLGAATALLLPVAVGLALDPARARWLRRAGAVAVPLLLVATAGSGARVAWVGLATAGLVVAVLRRQWLRQHQRAVAAIGALSAVTLALVVVLTPVGGRLAAVTDRDEPGGRGRLDEWRVAAAVVADHPVTGVGPEGYRIVFHEGVDERYERAHGRLQQPDRAHSAVLDVALTAGLPGLLVWLAVMVTVGRSVVVVLRRGSGWMVGVAAALVAHLAGQLLLFPIVELELLAWLLAGLVVASVEPVSVDLRRPGRGRRLGAAGLGVVAGLAAVVGIVDVIADRRAGVAIDALVRGDHRVAAVAAQDAVDLRPDEVRLRVLAATAVVADGQGTVAGLAELDHALDVSPGDPIVLLHRARLLVERAEATLVPAHLDRAEAEVLARRADDPSSAALWRLSARIAALRGDAAGRRDALARADALTPDDQRKP